jgi:hypothetical protein
MLLGIELGAVIGFKLGALFGTESLQRRWVSSLLLNLSLSLVRGWESSLVNHR